LGFGFGLPCLSPGFDFGGCALPPWVGGADDPELFEAPELAPDGTPTGALISSTVVTTRGDCAARAARARAEALRSAFGEDETWAGTACSRPSELKEIFGSSKPIAAGTGRRARPGDPGSTAARQR